MRCSTIAALLAALLLLAGCAKAAETSRSLLANAPETEDQGELQDDEEADVESRRRCPKGMDNDHCCRRHCPMGWYWAQAYTRCCQCSTGDTWDWERGRCKFTYPVWCPPWGPDQLRSGDRDRRDRDRRPPCLPPPGSGSPPGTGVGMPPTGSAPPPTPASATSPGCCWQCHERDEYDWRLGMCVRHYRPNEQCIPAPRCDDWCPRGMQPHRKQCCRCKR